MRKQLLAGLVVLAAVAAGRSASAGSAGAEPFDFLFLDAGARPVAMGGAATAIASDSEALLYNPAALGRGNRFETTFMHNQYANPITQEYLGFASPTGWGAQLNYLSFGRVTRTTIANPDGTGGSFGISDLALGAGYGREVGPGLRLGAAGKFLRESIDNVSAHGYAADLGALLSVRGDHRWTFGAALQNVGPTVRFVGAKESLPWTVRFGAACELQALGAPTVLALDLAKERSEGAVVSLGAETWLAPAFALRAGYSGRNDAGPGLTAGVGWRRKDVQFDYAMTPLGELGSAHRLSATIRWGRAPLSPAAAVASSTATGLVVRASPDVLLDSADEFLRLEMYPQAEKTLNDLAVEIPAEDGRQVRRMERLGTAYRRQGKIPEARAAYTEALTLAVRLALRDKWAAEAYAGMGFCLQAQGQQALASKFFMKALEGEPTTDTKRLVEAELRKSPPQP
ncbi:MAG: PorV/PorQ family protein [Elusimicrobia bacterium]|nr:PorV/PorQ family protein [Elusimicrobiota bacterium]